jgi:Flp pilus assembly protein TadD
VDSSVVRKLAIGLAVVGFVLFAPSITHPFHFDDVLILNDANVTNPAHWRNFLNPLHLRQLTYFSFYLNHLVAGINPASYHMVNVALHIANAVLFFFLLNGWFERRLALFAAAIFLVHPIQTEPVLYVYQRSILLACFFSVLALLAFKSNRHVLALILFVCAFESKESAVAIPFMLAVLVMWRSRGGAEESGSESVAPPGLINRGNVHPGLAPGATFLRRSAAVLLVIVLVMSAATIAILERQHEKTVGLGAATQVSPTTYLLTETRVIYTYLRLLVFPFPQSLEYDFAWIRTLDVATLLRVAGLIALIAVGCLLGKRSRWRVTGLSILAFFALLAPTSTFLPSTDPAFEHRLYLPMLAFSVFAASLLVRLKYAQHIVAALITVMVIATFAREQVWATDARLWENTVTHVPNKPRAWFNLGGAYMQSDQQRASAAYKRTIELRPDFQEAYYDLGVIAQNAGRYGEAVSYYQRCTSLDNGYWPAWNNLGNTWALLGEQERAVQAFETTLRLNPDHWPSQYNIAVVYFNKGRFDESIPRLRTVLDWRPDFRDARYLLAVALSRTGQRTEAEREWHNIEAIAGQPPMPNMIPTPAR